MSAWQFIDDKGTFRLKNPQNTNHLYFPLLNHAGMVSSITPMLNGDAKTGQNTFLLLPTSVEDLHNSRSARNFWVRINDQHIWSATGNSAQQLSQRFSSNDESVTLTAGLLWHTIVRENTTLSIRSAITNFVPNTDDTVELMKVEIENIGTTPINILPTAAIPIYGRSADHLRDHRHVTSLLNQIDCTKYGIIVHPTLSFDERKHTQNPTRFAVLGAEGDGALAQGFYPTVKSFIGEGGQFDWPRAMVNPDQDPCPPGGHTEGSEAMGGIQFKPSQLAPGESKSYILILGILPKGMDAATLLAKYGSQTAFDSHLETTSELWQDKTANLTFKTGDSRYDSWLRWVTLQPIFRRLIGNSFLPYHDYGRGGRGWRDLWQDALSLLILDIQDIRAMLLSYLAGVRFDGSNATIIGATPGEFKADRNNIPRVWMDHGAWPLETISLYLHQSGDIQFLLEQQSYFQDRYTHRANKINEAWDANSGTALKTSAGDSYTGTVLEHLLIQHLTAFFNVGQHNIIRLEGADWNDALDMAKENGESVAFSSYYAGNLQALAELCKKIHNDGVEKIAVAKELLLLLDTIAKPIDYESRYEKQTRVNQFFDATHQHLSGAKTDISLLALSHDLSKKAEWLTQQIRHSEWLQAEDGSGWFNSYYDNKGERTDDVTQRPPHMMLTGQVFAIMSGIATDEQIAAIVQAANKLLFDPVVGGHRLNTDFRDRANELGRVFGFAYGHKENGAMFSHMSTMYANALYRRGFVAEGWKVIKNIYQQSQNFGSSKIYPGIPEYFDPEGRGMYPYLTGSASWYLFTMLTQVYGIQGEYGDLVIKPQLMAEQFDQDGSTSIHTIFAGKNLNIAFHNPASLEFDEYIIDKVVVNGKPIPQMDNTGSVKIFRNQIKNWPNAVKIDITLIGTN